MDAREVFDGALGMFLSRDSLELAVFAVAFGVLGLVSAYLVLRKLVWRKPWEKGRRVDPVEAADAEARSVAPGSSGEAEVRKGSGNETMPPLAARLAGAYRDEPMSIRGYEIYELALYVCVAEEAARGGRRVCVNLSLEGCKEIRGDLEAQGFRLEREDGKLYVAWGGVAPVKEGQEKLTGDIAL